MGDALPFQNSPKTGDILDRQFLVIESREAGCIHLPLHHHHERFAAAGSKLLGNVERQPAAAGDEGNPVARLELQAAGPRSRRQRRGLRCRAAAAR